MSLAIDVDHVSEVLLSDGEWYRVADGALNLIRTNMCRLLTVQRPRQDWAADKRNLYLRLVRGGQNGIPPKTSAKCSVRLRRFRPFRTAGLLVQAANGQTRPLPSAAVIVST